MSTLVDPDTASVWEPEEAPRPRVRLPPVDAPAGEQYSLWRSHLGKDRVLSVHYDWVEAREVRPPLLGLAEFEHGRLRPVPVVKLPKPLFFAGAGRDALLKFGLTRDSPGLAPEVPAAAASAVKDPAGSDLPAAPRIGRPWGLRLRKRGRLTAVLESASRVELGWWSDLTSDDASRARAWLRHYGGGVLSKVVGGATIEGIVSTDKDTDDEVTKVTSYQLLSVPFKGDATPRALWVCPELLADLTMTRLFRPVSSALLGSLRGIARRWVEDRGISALDAVRFLPGTLVLAMLPMPDETTAVAALRGAAGRWSADVLGDLAHGVAHSAPSEPFGNFLKGPLSWFFRRTDTAVLGPGVNSLVLPA